jgi:hypothetical protein
MKRRSTAKVQTVESLGDVMMCSITESAADHASSTLGSDGVDEGGDEEERVACDFIA